MTENTLFSRGNPYSVIAPSGAYSASEGEFVISDGSEITLPPPVQDGVVVVRGPANQTIRVVPSSGQVQLQNNGIAIQNGTDTVFVSDGTNWYIRNQSNFFGLDIPDAVFENAISRWNFNDTSDTTTAIDSQDGNSMSIKGASYTSDSKEGSNAMSFNSSNSNYLTVGNMPSNLQLGDDSTSTIAAWVKTTNTNKNTIQATWTGNGRGFYLQVDNSNIVLFFRNPNNGNADRVRGSTNIADGNWHFVVGVRNGTTSNDMTVYVDGSEDNTSITASQGAGTFNATANYNIGRETRGQAYFDGKIDDVWAIETALSAQKISDWYDAY